MAAVTDHRLLGAALVCALMLCCTVAHVKGQEEGAVRLSGGSHAFQGFLEVYMNDKWGTVCSDNKWDEDDANIVCKQIGALNGVMSAKSNHVFTEVADSILVTVAKVKCHGTEMKLTECPFSNDTTSCTIASSVKMDCAIPGYKGCVKSDPRGNNPLIGRVLNPPGLTINTCNKRCREDGYHYAGVSELTCLCGSVGEDFKKYGVASNNECGSICQAAGSQACGSPGHFAVHEVMVGSCSGHIKASKGVIASPEFPGAYPRDDRTCQWVVDVSDNGDTAVRFPIFKVAADDEIHISTNGGKNWTVFKGSEYSQESPPSVATFDHKELMVKFVISRSGSQTNNASFVLTFQDDTSCDVIEFPNGHLDVVEGAAYRPGDKVEVLCDKKKFVNEWKYATCREDGFWYKAPVCKEAPPPGHSLLFTQTYLFMMLAVIGALGLIFFMAICGVICVGRKKKKEGYTGISRQESAEPTKAENEYHIDMHEGSDMDMQHVGGPEEQAVPLASGALDE